MVLSQSHIQIPISSFSLLLISSALMFLLSLL
nr:MAG TPA: hypothetical protein [Caudoviricetes sp.]